MTETVNGKRQDTKTQTQETETLFLFRNSQPHYSSASRASAYAHAQITGLRHVVSSSSKWASCSASLSGAPPSTIPMCWETKRIAWYPCTPSSTFKTFGSKLALRLSRPNEMAGLLKKMMMMKTPKIVKSRMSRFSRAKVEAGTGKLGLSIGRDHSDQSRSSFW